MARTLLLIDGEHVPSVIGDHILRLPESGRTPVAALFLGGFEKMAELPELGIPVLEGDPMSVIPQAIHDYAIAVVLDLSDEPIVDPRTRFALASTAMAAGAIYSGGGIELAPPPRPRLAERPTVSIIGTGKRTGKTGVSIALARHWRAQGMNPCIVTMGRGGPAKPLVLRAGRLASAESVLDHLTAEGLHATSDYVEDALFAGVDTVGTRRLGAGPAGVTVHDDFAAGVAEAISLDPGMIMFEGSGTAIPPAHADSTVLVTRSSLDPEYLSGYLGPFRLALANAVVIVGSGDSEPARLIGRIAPHVRVFPATFEPEPTVSVDGRSVVLVTTAGTTEGAVIERSLLAHGARSVRVVHSLSDRRSLAADLAIVTQDDLVLTELKAAAAAVVLPLAREVGADVGFLNNGLVVEGGTAALAEHLELGWPSRTASVAGQGTT
jgi:cyclic 2,3-diphosphoglycerate synthetase